MAYDDALAARVRKLLQRRAAYGEKQMFGGLCFLLHGNMCCGIVGSDLMARVGPERYDAALMSPHARPMDFTGKPLTGYVYVAPSGTKRQRDLERWVGLCVEFASTLKPKVPRKRAKKAPVRRKSTAKAAKARARR